VKKLKKPLDLEHLFGYIINMNKPSFTSPPDQALFNSQVWDIVRQIPPGKVASYGQVASFVPIPIGMNPKDYHVFSPRWVGGAMANCPPDVPWQRVVNGEGKISLPPSRGGTQQRELLEEEGIVFDAKDRINLKVFRWSGPVQS
jgi:methylated-DNA-protein-cysteine methyltransferase-like protein